MRNQDKQFLVEGALLECPYGTKHCRLLGQPDDAALKIGNKTFLGINTTKVKENIEGFGQCTKEGKACEDVIILEEYWRNPVSGNGTLTVQGENEAIHRKGRLLCLYGKKEIYAITTGQKELTESEKKFIRYMQENFGFDEEVILIMLKVIHAIDETYPDETERKKAWIFARLMGGFTYGYGEENRFVEIRDEIIQGENQFFFNNIVNELKQLKDIGQWWVTAGAFVSSPSLNYSLNAQEDQDELLKYFTTTLGLKEEEYHILQFHVMVQHEITSRPLHCFPPYLCDGIGDKEIVHRHPYVVIWKELYDAQFLYTSKNYIPTFEEEWNRLYNQYIFLSSKDRENLIGEVIIYDDYNSIEQTNNNIDEISTPYSPEPQYTDFTHQQILIATHTLEPSMADSLGGAVAGGGVASANIMAQSIFNPIIPLPMNTLKAVVEGGEIAQSTEGIIKEIRTGLAGWLGDIWLVDNKITLDDYKADLDGVNISTIIINEEVGTIEAVNEYYEAIERGKTTREKEFICNIGNGNIDTGLKNIETQNKFMNELMNLFKEESKVNSGMESFNQFMEQLSEGL